jgi:hypothetical protein
MAVVNYSDILPIPGITDPTKVRAMLYQDGRIQHVALNQLGIGGGAPPGTVYWADIVGKPSTYPPTLPIPESGVTNLVTDLAGKAPITFIGDNALSTPFTTQLWFETDTGITYIWYDDGTSAQWVQIASLETSVGPPGPPGPTGPTGPTGPAGASDWASITGKPATYPPTLPINESDVTNLTTDLAGKEPVIAGGTTAQYWRGDKTWVAFPAYEPPIAAGTTSQYLRGDKTWQTLDKTAVGLGNVDNTSDVNKPVSTATQTALNLKEDKANKSVANGYASLDASAKVPAAQLPAYVDDVLEYANLAAFPATGSTGIIYVALDTNKIYRWSGSVYIEISPSPGSTDAVPEGSVNLYYTNARASAAAPVQTVAGRTGAVTLTKTDVGLSNVLNVAQEPAISGGTIAQYWRGDKSWQTLNAAAVGLGNVSNTAQVTSVSGTAPVVSSGGTTPAISMAAATGSVNGYLTSVDWNTFNGKEPAIAAGTASQYWAGNKTWQTLPPATTLSDTAPGSPVHGQFWVETDTAALYVFYNDGTSSQWIQLSGPGV